MNMAKRSLCAALMALCAWQSWADVPVVAVSQIVAHPALDADFQGLVDALAEAGYKDGETVQIKRELAQGDSGISTQIAQKFVGEKPAVLVGISTPSAQSLAAAARGRFPIVFTAVTDPLQAKLVDNLDKPGKNITGVSDAVPLEKNIELMQSLLPELKTIGTVFNPGEANSVAAIAELEKIATAKGLKLLQAPATKTSEVLDASRSLVGKAQAIFITTDNTAISAFSSIVQVAEAEDIPLFTADSSSVASGAIAALGFSFYEIGRETGKQVAAVLKGEKIGDIAVKFMATPELYLNPQAAERMGLTLPQAVIDSAKHVLP